MEDTRARQIEDLLSHNPIVPVVVIDNPDDAVPAGEALKAGGIFCAEVTLRTDQALDVIARMNTVDNLTVGAGTVCTAQQAEEAIAHGAQFLVSPGFSPEVAEVSKKHNIPLIPGGVTPTEIIRVLEAGMSTVKFFPAEAMGGISVVKALSAPFPQVTFLPTGGVGASNMAQWRALACVASVGGSWMITRDMVARHEFEKITALSAQAIAIAKES